MRYPFVLACSVLVVGCTTPPDSTAAPTEPAPAVVTSEPSDGTDTRCACPRAGVENEALDFTPSESVAEAHEPQLAQAGLAFTCALAAYVAVKFGCDDGDYFTNVCPPGRHKIIQDTWDKSKFMIVSCDFLRTLVCGTSEISGAAALAKLCGHVRL